VSTLLIVIARIGGFVIARETSYELRITMVIFYVRVWSYYGFSKRASLWLYMYLNIFLKALSWDRNVLMGFSWYYIKFEYLENGKDGKSRSYLYLVSSVVYVMVGSPMLRQKTFKVVP
jgi:hypothetical protein